MKIGELFVQLGVITETSKVEQFAASLNNTTLKAAGLVAGLVGVSLSIKHLLSEAMDLSMGFSMFEAQTALSGQEMQRWEMRAQQAGASAGAATSSVMALQRAITDIRLGGGNVKPFQMLGLDINQNPFQILDQIRTRIADMDRGVATNLISQLGINPEMIRLLTMTNAQFKAMAGDDTILSEKNRQRFVQTRQELTRLKQEFNYFAMSMISDFLPFTKDMVKAIADWKAGLVALGLVAATIAAYFFPITTALTALILLMQDYYTYTKGGDSIFGDIAKAMDSLDTTKAANKLPGTGPVIDDAINSMLDFFKIPRPAGMRQVTQTNNVKIDVNGSAPAKETAAEVKAQFDKVVDRAATQANNEGY